MFILILDASLIFRMPGSNHKLTLKSSGYIDIGGLLSWPAARGPVGARLAITICLFFEISLSNSFRKVQPPIKPPEPRPQANNYFM